MQDLAGRVAIITGAGSGIGRAAVRLFREAGASVLAIDRSDEGLRETRDGLDRVETMLADAGDEKEVAAAVARAVTIFGRLDAVFANAGISGNYVPVIEDTIERWQEVLRVNLLGPFLLIKHAAPVLVARGKGAIVCTASVAGLRATTAGAPYSASKAGVISLVQTAANSLAGTGVRVNAVCPGLIETGMTKPLFEAARSHGTEDRIGQLNPQRRAGKPCEVAAAALFLASDAASYVNGQTLPVDGGLSSTLPFAPERRRP